MLYLNYPNNPTAAAAPLEYLSEAVDFCRENDVVLVYDHAYSEIAFNAYRPQSVGSGGPERHSRSDADRDREADARRTQRTRNRGL